MMNSFLTDFLTYFMPDLELPAWIQAYFGLTLLILVVKLVTIALDR